MCDCALCGSDKKQFPADCFSRVLSSFVVKEVYSVKKEPCGVVTVKIVCVHAGEGEREREREGWAGRREGLFGWRMRTFSRVAAVAAFAAGTLGGAAVVAGKSSPASKVCVCVCVR